MSRISKNSKLAGKRSRSWSVYMVRCADGSFYTGATNDVQARVAKHNSGAGAAYTRSRRPVRLIHLESGLARGQALRREAAIKALPRNKKEILINQNEFVAR